MLEVGNLGSLVPAAYSLSMVARVGSMCSSSGHSQSKVAASS